MRKPSLIVIFITVFIDLVGFGLVIPLLPSYSRDFGASGFETGLLFASYSLMQFLFAPWWGSLSDRIGRRPVLLISTAGAALAYSVFAIGSGMSGRTGLGILFLSRILGGICGANISVAQAYIADITSPADRSKRMGIIGIAFGLGFTVGPGLAAIAMMIAGPTGPGWLAATVCAGNFVFAFFRLPESWTRGTSPTIKRARFEQFQHVARRPVVGFLVLVFALATFGFTCFESTLGLLIQQNFALDRDGSAKTIAIIFCYCGVIGALVQAGPAGRLVKRIGEARLIVLSLFLFALSMAPLPFIKGVEPLTARVLLSADGWPWWQLLIAVAFLAIGSGLTRPPLFGLLSNLTPQDEQGATMGVAQSAGSLARVVGPPLAGWLFDIHASWPYLLCTVLVLFTCAIAWQRLAHLPLPNPPSPPPNPATDPASPAGAEADKPS
jgi:MFS family permease